MKRTANLLLMVVFVTSLIVSGTIYCQPSTELEFRGEWNPANNICTAELGGFSIPLAENEEYTVYIHIPLDLKLLEVYMRLYPEEGEPDVTVTLGSRDSEPIIALQDEFTGFRFTQELNSFIKDLEPNQKARNIRVPLVFASQQGGTLTCRDFTIRYSVNTVAGLELLSDSTTGMPTYFLWNGGKGANPEYEFQIRSERDFFSPSAEVLLEKKDVNTFCKLLDRDFSDLASLEPGKYYSWGVRVVYQEVGKSRWAYQEFTILEKPLPVEKEDIDMNIESNRAIFSWKNPGNAECYYIELNGQMCEENYDNTSYSIDITNLCLCGENTFTIWGICGDKKSTPTEYPFPLSMEQLEAPNIDSLYPSSDRPVTKAMFTFFWDKVSGAKGYEIQVFDHNGNPMKLPTEGGREEIVELEGKEYNPWNEGLYGEHSGLDLIPGKVYTWKVRAIPKPDLTSPLTGEPPAKSEWVAQIFLYQPILLRILTLFSAVGGLIGGFFRIARDERSKSDEKKQGLKIFRNYRTYMDLLVAIGIGVIFYLIINQTLSQQLNPLNIPPFNHVGSFLLGFIGGVISYNVTRLQVVPTE